MHRMHLAATAAFIAALIGAPAAVAAPPDVDSTRLEQLVTVQGITEHQKALQNIADHERRHALHAHAGLHRLGRLREGDAGEGGLRRALRDVQHAHLA